LTAQQIVCTTSDAWACREFYLYFKELKAL